MSAEHSLELFRAVGMANSDPARQVAAGFAGTAGFIWENDPEPTGALLLDVVHEGGVSFGDEVENGDTILDEVVRLAAQYGSTYVGPLNRHKGGYDHASYSYSNPGPLPSAERYGFASHAEVYLEDDRKMTIKMIGRARPGEVSPTEGDDVDDPSRSWPVVDIYISGNTIRGAKRQLSYTISLHGDGRNSFLMSEFDDRDERRNSDISPLAAATCVGSCLSSIRGTERYGDLGMLMRTADTVRQALGFAAMFGLSGGVDGDLAQAWLENVKDHGHGAALLMPRHQLERQVRPGQFIADRSAEITIADHVLEYPELEDRVRHLGEVMGISVTDEMVDDTLFLLGGVPRGSGRIIIAKKFNEWLELPVGLTVPTYHSNRATQCFLRDPEATRAAVAQYKALRAAVTGYGPDVEILDWDGTRMLYAMAAGFPGADVAAQERKFRDNLTNDRDRRVKLDTEGIPDLISDTFTLLSQIGSQLYNAGVYDQRWRSGVVDGRRRMS